MFRKGMYVQKGDVCSERGGMFRKGRYVQKGVVLCSAQKGEVCSER